ncbi:hypothetical protein LX87_00934 [Larkinella arboricola]|uniref:Uncharacterized protein n=1 Tax=Larkinella arboricola TaxID=643671 RepID=A0A327X9P0_LARAB|nr:hypothetical protein [Larkinella arboricola]RAK02814.1 hypothetical protein LX87_00934 [Larkinella arboricola]
MKTILLMIGIGLFHSAVLWAQTAPTIRVKGGPNWQRSVPFEERYRYPQFRTGTITYRNGLAATGRFNYNILIGEMQFIDAKGDTLALANENTIRAVQVAQTTFVYDQKYGFMEVTADYNTVKLAMKPIFKTVRAEKNGAYNQSSGTSSITQYKSFIGSTGQLARLEQEGDLLLEKEVVYLVIDPNNRFYRLSRGSILKIFPKNKSAIEAYLKAESIDFKKEADLKKLLQFCSELSI